MKNLYFFALALFFCITAFSQNRSNDLNLENQATDSSFLGSPPLCKTITGRILPTDPVETGRLLRDGVASVCGTPKVSPPIFATAGYVIKHTPLPILPRCRNVSYLNLLIPMRNQYIYLPMVVFSILQILLQII